MRSKTEKVHTREDYTLPGRGLLSTFNTLGMPGAREITAVAAHTSSNVLGSLVCTDFTSNVVLILRMRATLQRWAA
jgi:hypothetical protein